MLRLALLGPPVVELDGTAARFDTRKAVALLAVLATARAEQSRERLAALFWPDSDDERSRSSLRRTLSVTASATGSALVVTRSTVALDESQVSCDLWDFERLAAGGDAASLAAALSLYRDDFLAGFRPGGGPELDDWQQLVGEEQRQRLGRVLAALVEARAGCGELDGALVAARRWLALDEMHEPAHQATMRLLSWTGQRGAAIAQYRRCVRVLERELGVAPLPATSALYEDILADRLEPPPARQPGTAPRLGHTPLAATERPDAAGATEGGATAPGATEPGATAPGSTPPGATAAGRLPLVGRERELGALLGAFGRVASGGGQLATVVGPGGSGKTRLVEELRDELATRGVGNVVVHCYDGERGIAFGVVTAMLRSALRARPDLADHLDPAERAEVARLVPQISPARDQPVAALESPGAQVRFFDALGVALVTALCAATGSAGLAVVEDAQFVDDASAQLLGYLIRRLDASPLLLVATWQSDAAPPAPMAGAIADAERAGRATPVVPPPFGRADVERLLEVRGLRSVDPETLLAHTGGLPLLVVAYLDALGDAERSSDHADPDLPTGARQLLEERLAAVSPATAQVLTAAAVLGGRCDAELLRLTSGRGALEVADALDEAVSRGLLVEQTPQGGTGPAGYDFAYQALRRVAYETCGSARRRLLHSRAADVLARAGERSPRGSSPGAVSAHLRRAGREDEAAAWSWQAAQRSLSLYAHAEALGHLRDALELGAPAAEAHTAIAGALIALGRYREAIVELEQAAAALEPADGRLAEIEHRLAGVHDRLGGFAAAAAHLDAARALAGADGLLTARIAADRAFVAYRMGDEQATALAESALASAVACGDAHALAQARNVAGVLAALGGDAGRAEQLLGESLQAARSLPDPGPAVASLNNLGRLLADLGRHGEALAAAEEALALGERHGDVHRVGALHSNLADLLHALGRTEESIAHLKLSAAAIASVDAGAEVRPEVWTLVEW